MVTPQMLSRVKPGMTKSQVRFILGTPLLADIFHPDRWEYVYRYQKADVLTEQYHVTAIFEKDLLLRIDGKVLPGLESTTAPLVEVKPLVKPE